MLAGGADPGSAHWFLYVLVNACEDRTAQAVSVLHAQGSTATVCTNGTDSTGPAQSSGSIFNCLWEFRGQG